jgi:hypothetical protein
MSQIDNISRPGFDPEEGDIIRITTNKGYVEKQYHEPGEPTPPPPKTKMTKLSFKQRFTPAERIAIRVAAETNPIIFDFMDLVSDATYIDKSRLDTIEAVQYLEVNVPLDAGRANTILTTPITDEEEYKG